MSQYIYTSDITDQDLLRVEIFSVAVDCNPMDALGCWQSESANMTTAWNHNGGASGIFQAMPAILKGLGYRADLEDYDDARCAAFRAETYSTQVQWATRYYRPYKGKLKTMASFYVATFLPADLDYAAAGDDSTVLVQKDGRRGWAFSANAGFDENHDLKITVGELTDAIKRACVGPRWEELSERMADQLKQPHVVVNTPSYDLGTIIGVQQALNLLGYNVGTPDGIIGPLFRNGIVAFQKTSGLDVDGIYGPNTRAALQKALDSVIHKP